MLTAEASPVDREESAACWQVDLSRVQGLIASVAAGSEWADWVGALVHGARIVDANRRSLDLVGALSAREILLGQPVANFCPPESWPALAELIVAVAADPLRKAGARAISSFLLRDATLTVWGQPGLADTLWVQVAGEIADERSFWAVRASEQRYRRLIHHLPGALLQVDARRMAAVFYELRAEGITDIAAHFDAHPELVEQACQLVRVIDANGGAARLVGADSVEALIGPVAFVFARSPDAARNVTIAHFEGLRTHVERIALETFDGRLLDVELTVTFPTPPERLDITLLSLEDVTDRLRTEAELRQLQERHAHAARISTLGELASSIAHEVNQPLAAIAMNADTSLRWLAREEPNLAKVDQLTRRIADSARHASQIVQRIKGMATRNPPDRALIDLNAVVEEALMFVCHDVEQRKIFLAVRLDIGLPRILGDRVQLQQVIVNLLVNSLQAIAEAGEGRIEISTGADDAGGVRFSIRDTGPGIAAEDLDRIFEGFFTTKPSGMGIGLAVCQSIIGAHGGRIVAANHVQGGAQFHFTLPPVPA